MIVNKTALPIVNLTIIIVVLISTRNVRFHCSCRQLIARTHCINTACDTISWRWSHYAIRMKCRMYFAKQYEIGRSIQNRIANAWSLRDINARAVRGSGKGAVLCECTMKSKYTWLSSQRKIKSPTFETWRWIDFDLHVETQVSREILQNDWHVQIASNPKISSQNIFTRAEGPFPSM